MAFITVFMDDLLRFDRASETPFSFVDEISIVPSMETLLLFESFLRINGVRRLHCWCMMTWPKVIRNPSHTFALLFHVYNILTNNANGH